MGGLRAGVLLAIAGAVSVSACEDGGPKCIPGTRAEGDHCVEDGLAEKIVRIEKGCVLSPDPLVIAPLEDFQFDNRDDERHVVSIQGGKVLEDLAPGGLSRLIRMSGPGEYPYEIASCSAHGTVVVK